jgi:hypothetical protein
MIGRRIEDVSEADLSSLIANAVREGRTIEYKQTLPGGSDGDKKEFLADVSSFANSSGGDILYGVAAASGVPVHVVGLSNVDKDKESLRLESVIRDGLDPRIPGIRMQFVDVAGSGPVLVIRVPKSWAAPHRVSFRDSSRFFSRSSAGKFQMDTDELRSSFAMTTDLPGRIRAWRDARLAKILAGDTPVQLADAAKMVLHLAPLSSMDKPNRISAQELDGNTIGFAPMWTNSWDSRINLDGYATHGARGSLGPEGLATTYCQVFRSGQIEAVSASLVRDNNGRKTIASIGYEQTLLQASARYIRALATVEVEPPLIVMVAFLGARGATIAVNDRFGGDLYPIDGDVLVLPDVLIDETPTDLPRAMRPIFDAAWNACGVAQSVNYDKNGKWAADRLQDVPMGGNP